MLNGLEAAVAETPEQGLPVSLGPARPPTALHPAPGTASVPAQNHERSALHLSARTLPAVSFTSPAAAPSGLRPAGSATQTERRPASSRTPQQLEPAPAAGSPQPKLAGAPPPAANATSVMALPLAAQFGLPPSPAPAQISVPPGAAAGVVDQPLAVPSARPVAPAPAPAQISVPPGAAAGAANQPPVSPTEQPVAAAPAVSPDPPEDAGRFGALPEGRGFTTDLATAASRESGAAPMSLTPGPTLGAGEIAFGARLVVRVTEQAGADPARALPAPQAPASGNSAPAPWEAPESPAAFVEGMSQPATANLNTVSPRDGESCGAGTAVAPDSRGGRPVQPESQLPYAEQPNPAPAPGGAHTETAGVGYVPAPQPQAPAPSAAPSHTGVADPGLPAGWRGSGSAPPDMPGSGAARDIALRLSSDDQSAVEVRLSERAGEVHVAVRSADPQMAESMRAHLPELVDRLGARGFDTEIWRPQPAATAQGGFNSHSDAHGERQGEPGQQQGGSRQKRDQSQPEWLEELAASFHQPTSGNRSTNL